MGGHDENNDDGKKYQTFVKCLHVSASAVLLFLILGLWVNSLFTAVPQIVFPILCFPGLLKKSPSHRYTHFHIGEKNPMN